MNDLATRGGQNLCWWHSNIFGKLAKILGVAVPDATLLRPENESDFEAGCLRYRCEVVYLDKYKEGAD